jgi:CRP-like cAMP-binding protein
MEPVQLLADFLREHSTLNRDQVALVCSFFRCETFPTETTIVRQGTRYRKIVFVAEGILRVFVRTPEDGDVVKNFVETSEFFADLECIEKDLPAVINVASVTRCTLLTLSKVDSDRLCRELPEWLHLSREGAMQAMNQMIRKQTFLRLGSASDRYRYLVENQPNIVRHVSLKYIASYLGITQSSLSRIRKQGW